jgi:hypothetical protein
VAKGETHMTNIANLKKAFQTRAITQDTFSLQKFVAKHGEANKDGVETARAEIVGLEVKYIAQFDASNPHAKAGVAGNGFRTRFFLKDGSTIGTFSNGAYNFFRFFAEIMGHNTEGNFLHIDIDGQIFVDISILPLDGNKSTYNFDLVEEGSELKGLSEYAPSVDNVLAIEG